MERQILHVVIPSFPIALARRKEPELRERPVAVAPGNSERALLQAVSTEAAAEGLFPGMSIFRARRLCPALRIIPPDPLLVARGTDVLSGLAGGFSPVVEIIPGRTFLDLTGCGRLFGPPRDVAARLERSIRSELGVEAMAGTGGNKLVSRLAADALPESGVYDVFNGAERAFIAPFPLTALPGIGDERQGRLLQDLNLTRVEQVAALSVPQLRLVVGAFAPLLHERACGIDRSPVQPPRRRTEIVEESFLSRDDNDDAVLLAELYRLAEGCGLTLRRMGKGAGKLVLTVQYADGVSEQRATTLAPPHSLDLALFAAVEELFFTTCRRRLRVRALRLACFPVSGGTGQMELFPVPTTTVSPHQAALQEALDGLRARHGRDVIRWGRSLPFEGEAAATETAPPPSKGADLSAYRYCTETTRPQ